MGEWWSHAGSILKVEPWDFLWILDEAREGKESQERLHTTYRRCLEQGRAGGEEIEDVCERPQDRSER